MENVKKKRSDKQWADVVNYYFGGGYVNKDESPTVIKNDSAPADVETKVEYVESSKPSSKIVPKESVSTLRDRGENKAYKKILIELDEESACKASIYALLNHVSRRVWIQNIIMEKMAQMEPINLKVKRNEKE